MHVMLGIAPKRRLRTPPRAVHWHVLPLLAEPHGDPSLAVEHTSASSSSCGGGEGDDNGEGEGEGEGDGQLFTPHTTTQLFTAQSVESGMDSPRAPDGVPQ